MSSCTENSSDTVAAVVVGVRRTLFIAAALVCFTAPASADTITFGSDTTWNVSDSSNNPVGTAEYVVLNATFPTRQPPGAIDLGAGNGWSADISSIPTAYWIWAPGITGATPNASLAEYSFPKQFELAGPLVSGSISVAVDDYAQVVVNGNLVGTTGSVTDVSLAFQAQSALVAFNLSPYLVSGLNTIEIIGQNGPDSFSGFPNADYQENPAGVVFGGTLTSFVPEPSSLFLAGTAALGGLLTWARRRRV